MNIPFATRRLRRGKKSCYAAILLLMQVAASGSAWAQTVTPATPPDPVVHHHQAYPVAAYGLSCPGDRVVWVNTRTGIYHLEGERWFGRTKQGQFECEKAAKAEGDRETRNGQ